MPEAARSCQELIAAARNYQELSGAAGSCEELQNLAGAARSCQELVTFRTLSQTLPDGNFQLSCKEVGIGLIEQLNCTELSSFNKLTELTD